MTEQADPIPNELRQAFREILWHFESWRPPLPEIELSINGTFQQMSAVCDLVSVYSDALPSEVHEQLLSALHSEERLRAPYTEQPMLLGEIAHLLRGERERLNIRQLEALLAAESTYKTGGFCLLRLIETQKSRYLGRTKPRQ